MSYETYYIPTNYTDAGRALGLFEIRNLIEAAVVTVPTIFLCLKYLPMSLTARIMAAVTISVPLGGFALIGIAGDSLSRWLICWLRWYKSRRYIRFRGEVKGK